jgi:tetratricopeptide (TPR) repeat protein
MRVKRMPTQPAQPQTAASRPALRAAARFAAAAAAVCVAYWLASASLRAGASRYVADHGVRSRSAQEVELAARLAPSDPEAYFARAWLLSNAGDLEGATTAYGRALALRPNDHVLWLELGKVRDGAGDSEGALRALGRAVELAPYYAQPRWQLGNALLRAGRRGEAFEELRKAAASDPALYPNFIQSLWYTTGRDPRAFADAARPSTPDETLAVVRFLIKAGAAPAGIKVLRESSAPVAAEVEQSLLADLIAAGDFADAYDIWSEGREAGGRGAVFDGGFEAEARMDDQGFGWRFARDAQAIKFSLDPDSPREGARSLKVEYAGTSDPNAAVVSQLVPVEPGARYRLTFSARTRELITGGPPFIEVVSASKGGGALATLPTLSPAMNEWRDFSTEFAAPQGAGAVRVALMRQPCASSPCPAFGSVWLDAFKLQELRGERGK